MIDPRLGGSLSCQFCLLGAESQAGSVAGEQPSQVDQRAAVTTAHIEDVHRGAKVEKADAVLEHPDLRFLGRFVALEKKAMMNVVAPESAIDEGERIVMLSNLLGGNRGGGHEQSVPKNQ